MASPGSSLHPMPPSVTHLPGLTCNGSTRFGPPGGSVRVRVARRPGRALPGMWPDPQRGRGRGHGSPRRWAPGNPWRRRLHDRGRSGLDWLPPRPGGPWPVRGATGRLGRPRGPEGLHPAVLPGAAWQRCRIHCARNLPTRVPKAAQDFVAALVRSIFAQPNAQVVWAQLARGVEQLRPRFPQAAWMLQDAVPDVLAFTSFPKEHWRQIWSTNPRRGLTRNSAAAPTSSASSPTAKPSSASSAPSCASSTTTGPSPGAT